MISMCCLVVHFCVYLIPFFCYKCDEYNFQYLWICFYNKSRLEDIVGGTEKRTRMTRRKTKESSAKKIPGG